MHTKSSLCFYSWQNEMEEVPCIAHSFQVLTLLNPLLFISHEIQMGPGGCDRYYFELIEFSGSLLAYFDQIIRIIITELLDFLFPSVEKLGAYLEMKSSQPRAWLFVWQREALV